MSADTKWLDKVNLLLAKAESTEFPEEAEALFDKAQALMAAHSIDEAMLRAAGKTRDDVITTLVMIQNPYLNQKSTLLSYVAKANGVQTIQMVKEKGSVGVAVSLVGFESDIENTKMMFANLSTFAVRDMLKQRVPSNESARAFRIAYIMSFAIRIGERLAESTKAAEEQYAETTPGVGLVLVEKKAEVTKAFREAFPNVRYVQRSYRKNSGAKAGAAAADRANLNKGVGRGSQRALSA